jgi:hypothetical protein
MSDLEALRRTAVVGVALVVVVAVVSTPIYLAAFGWDLEAADQPDSREPGCNERDHGWIAGH